MLSSFLMALGITLGIGVGCALAFCIGALCIMLLVKIGDKMFMGD